ncbi:MAG TPA: hypothetical protein VH877_02120 [Polyangia bacterium]|jgi:hypothetical protein|nr:hypothetical protein [Polyangia bacterium]
MNKKTEKKLKLSTETVRVLQPGELGQAIGGITAYVTCSCTLRLCTI